MTFRSIRWLIVPALTLPGAAAAQVAPALDPGVMVGYAGGAANHYSLEKRPKKSPAAAFSLRDLDRRAFTGASATTAITRYTPSAEATAQNMRRFVARTRAVDPAAAADLEASLRGGALVGKARVALRDYGLDASDVADAAAGYLVTAWYAARGSDRDPGKTMLRAVRNQLATAMAASPSFRSADNRAKQELAEAMIIHTIYAGAAIKQSKTDPARLRHVSAAIAAGARNTFGFAMDAVMIGEHGLRFAN